MNVSAETLAQRAERLQPHFTVTIPEGDGPFPVVLMMHGCGGPRPMFRDWARALAEAGSASIAIDSFSHRGIGRVNALTTVCTGAQLRGRERAGDLYATYAWARAQPWADPQRVVAAGWSHGGWTIFDALAMHSGAEMQRATGLDDLPAEPLAELAGVFFIYPYAGVPSLAGKRAWRVSPRTFAIVGGRDYIAGTETPRRALERQAARGATIEIAFYPEVTHAFDDAQAWHPLVRYDARATARAHSALRDFVVSLN
jgi:dienelactone hydrolase